ncbi:multiheme c-type cytochrome, partial [Candidatus Hydrogenedentota bacterium]
MNLISGNVSRKPSFFGMLVVTGPVVAAAVFLGASGCEQLGYVGTKTCTGCHNGLTASNQTSFLDSSHYESGIGCEDCHGPGYTHVRAIGSPGHIISNPSGRGFENSYKYCGNCH